MNSSTLPSALDHTTTDGGARAKRTTLKQQIGAEWSAVGDADLVDSVRRHPDLLRDQSLLLSLAVDEYNVRNRGIVEPELKEHCARFRKFGTSIYNSIFRRLDAKRYFDKHQELFEIQWPELGDTLEQFYVIEELGRGAIARVYLCRESAVGNREVVVKYTPFSTNEASILGRLKHKNIIPIFSTGYIPECKLHYVCMDFCGRSTLIDLLDIAFPAGVPRTASPIHEAATRWLPNELTNDGSHRQLQTSGTYVGGIIKVALEIGDALLHAHRNRILHGDLKPSNILLTPTASPILLDFNLSRDQVHPQGLHGGTLPYMPPELLMPLAGMKQSRHRNSFDPRPDIYSFGALLHELLTGVNHVALPSNADDVEAVAESLIAQSRHGVVPIRNRNGFVGHRLEKLIMRCLAFNPDDRPNDMGEVIKLLKREARVPASIRRVARARPILFLTLMAILIAGIVGAATFMALRPPQYLRYYEQGLAAVAAGDAEHAAELFDDSVKSNPTFDRARFARAHAELVAGNIDSAMISFRQLVDLRNDADSMAYLGYCFNLKGNPAAAGLWYEKAIERGARSLAVFNNLGASYITSQTRLRLQEQIRRAESYLSRALAIDPNSTTVHLNIVRCALSRSSVDQEYDPYQVSRSAQVVLTKFPNDRLVQSYVAAWYDACNNHENLAASPLSANRVAEQQELARKSFETLRRVYRESSSESKRVVATLEQGHPNKRDSVIKLCFLEPIPAVSESP